MEQGFDITLYEQNDFWAESSALTGTGKEDNPHEHCYHMYLNWYNNFWQFMHEIGALDKFISRQVIGYRRPGDKQTRQGLNQCWIACDGSDQHVQRRRAAGDQFISAYSLLDLIGTQAMSGRYWSKHRSIIFFAPGATAPMLRSTSLRAPWRRPSPRRAIFRRREAIRA